MNQPSEAVAAPPDPATRINPHYLWAAAAALAVLAGAVWTRDEWLLRFIHVLAGLLWSGIDLFMGFIVGPIVRKLEPEARRAMVTRLLPRTLFLLPTLAILTTTAGWYLAVGMGYLNLPAPQIWWIIAALVVVAILTVQGMFVLLPINLTVYFECRKAQPDIGWISRRMKYYVWIIASQGLMQVLIIVIMVQFATSF